MTPIALCVFSTYIQVYTQCTVYVYVTARFATSGLLGSRLARFKASWPDSKQARHVCTIANVHRIGEAGWRVAGFMHTCKRVHIIIRHTYADMQYM